MSQNSVSPLLQSRLNQQNNPQTAQEIKEAVEEVKETAQKAGFLKEHKGLVITAAALAATSAIVVGGLIYKGKLFPELKLQKEGEKILQGLDGAEKEMQALTNDAQKQYNEVMAIIQKGQETGYLPIFEDNKTIQFFQNQENGALTAIEETDAAGELLRRSSIYEDSIACIEEFIQGTNKSDLYIYDANSFVWNVYKGLETIDEANLKCDAAYDKIFGCGNSLYKDAQMQYSWSDTSPYTVTSAKERYFFNGFDEDDENFIRYTQEYSFIPGGELHRNYDYHLDKEFMYKNGKLASAQSGDKFYKVNDKGKLKPEKIFQTEVVDDYDPNEVIFIPDIISPAEGFHQG
ncbi:hypothetical protein IJ531_00405 [bacterium]|nr:hypothetical protein [bacterium]